MSTPDSTSNSQAVPVEAPLISPSGPNYHSGSRSRRFQDNLISGCIRVLTLKSLKALAIHARLTVSHGFTISDRIQATPGDLARILVECTGLQYLGIRGECASLEDGPVALAPASLVAGPADVVTKRAQESFKDLCIQYQALGGAPLSLKSLNVGEFLFLCPYVRGDQDGDSDGKYLKYLTKTEELEELHLWNGSGKTMELGLWNESAKTMELGLINPTDMPRLKRLYLEAIDYWGFRYLSRPDMRDFVRKLHLSVRCPKVVYQLGWRPAPGVVPEWRRLPPHPYVADFINDQVNWALQPGSLCLSFTMWQIEGSFHVPAPWPSLRLLKAIVPGNYYALTRFVTRFIKDMHSLEFLWISMSAFHPRLVHMQKALNSARLNRFARHAAGYCPNLKYVGFDDVEHTILVPKGSSRVYKITRKEPVMKDQKLVPKLSIVEVNLALSEEVVPVEFWSQDRKMSSFVDDGPF